MGDTRDGLNRTQGAATQPPGSRGFVASTPWKQAFVFGLMAFAVGFLITTGLVFGSGSLQESTTGLGDVLEDIDDVSPLTVTGWIFYSTHFVEIEADLFVVSISVDILSESSDELVLPTPVWRLLPVGVLTGTGYLLASWSLPAGLRKTEYAKRGATIVVGYAPLVVMGTVLFTDSVAGISVGPGLFESLLIAGLVYPLLCGGVGGYVAAQLQSRRMSLENR